MRALILLVLFFNIVFICSCDKDKTESVSNEYKIDKIYNKGDFSLRVKLLKQEYALWETIELIIQTSSKVEISSFAEITEKPQDFKILSQEQISDSFDDRANVVKTTKVVIEPMRQGDIEIDTISAKFGDSDKITADTISIDIKSQIKSNDPNFQPSDIENVINLPFRISGLGWGVIIAVFLMSVIVIYIFVRKKKTQIKPLIIKRADEMAFERIDDLLSQRLIEKGLLEEFYSKLCNILRYYIEDRFAVRAAEMTTEEFLQEVSNGNILDSQERLSLEDFLVRCDLVKFAKASVTVDKVSSSVDMARNFITRTTETMQSHGGN